MRPLLLRPAFLGRGSRRDFSGVVQVISAKSETVWKRLPALVGLRCLTAVGSFPSFPLANPLREWRVTPDYHGTARIHPARHESPAPFGGAGGVPSYSAACWLPKISIVSPAARVTTAFFQERVVPGVW